MSEVRVSIPFARKGDPDVRTVVLPAGFISLEDLLSHVGYQLDMGNALVDELDRQLDAERRAGRREMAEALQAQIDQRTAGVKVDMESAHRILTAELTGYAPTPEDGLAA